MVEVDLVKLSITEMPRIVTTESLYRLADTNSNNEPVNANKQHEIITSDNNNNNDNKRIKEVETKNENYNINDLIPEMSSADTQSHLLRESVRLKRPQSQIRRNNNNNSNHHSNNNCKKANATTPIKDDQLIHEKIFKKLIKKHDISRFFSKKLRVLYDFKIVFILDDSGSMNERLDDSPLNRGDYKATRWDELQEFMKISIEIASVLNEVGCDVYFLNRPMVKSIRKFEDLKPSFKSRPSGLTPITAILSKVLKNNLLYDKKLLTIIVTDGEPTNTEGRVDIKGFKECLISRPNNVFTTILACTDEDNSMEYLNNWDKYIQRLDVVDDFRSERQEIRKSQGTYFHFTYGDYVVKSLIGSTDPSIDNLDESKFKCCRIL